MTFLQKLEETITTRKLFRDGHAILVGVSGGVDSMVLLYALHALARRDQWSLTVAHFNHQLRGRSSDADERLVRQTAKKLKLPIVVGTHDVKRFAKKNKLSIEMAARELRHKFFAKTALTKKITAVALAHHGDDQAELFFIRLLRGAGGEGLSGMSALALSPMDKRVTLVRPLLQFAKTELLQFAEEQHIGFREDATNAQVDFLRNRIRHELIPILQQIQPGAVPAILRTMDIVRGEAECVLALAVDWLSGDNKKPLTELPLGVQRRCIELQLRTLGIPPEFDLIEQLRLSSERPVSVAAGKAVKRTANGHVSLVEPAISFQKELCSIDLQQETKIEWEGCLLSWSFESRAGTSLRPKPGIEYFDADAVGSRIVLRHWKEGDRFQPIGMKSPVKLQDLFVNQKVPQKVRHRLVLAENQKGHIFWVEGLRIGETCKLTSVTRRRLKWCFQRHPFGHCG